MSSRKMLFAQAARTRGTASLLLVRVILGERRKNLVLDRVHQTVAFQLRMFRGIERVAEPLAVLLLDFRVQRFVKRGRLDVNLRRLHAARPNP